jgi:predicted HNH restriction endonuclease
MEVKLNKLENRIRKTLINVAKGQISTYKSGLISYKELWETFSRKPWVRVNTKKIINYITKISAHDLLQEMPPLNELVVNKKTSEPGESWESIKSYHTENFKVEVPYSSHQEAREACWKYWGRKNNRNISEIRVMEGEKQDKTVIFRRRNAKIISQRKKLDDYKCQACGFRLKIGEIYIIDCHHTKPLGLNDAITVTDINDLICLCPTCHRIAHTERYPLNVDEIKQIKIFY